MRLSAVMSVAEVEAAARAWFPMELALEDGDDPKRALTLHELDEFELVPDVGGRFTCAGRLAWTVGPTSPTFTLHTLRMLLKLSLRAVEGGVVLDVEPDFEEVDVAGVPSLIDRGVARAVQRRLAERIPRLTWRISDSLSWGTALPGRLRSANAFSFTIPHAVLTITRDGLRLDGEGSLAVGLIAPDAEETAVPKTTRPPEP